MAYDPYFGKYVCRQCGHTENTSCVENIELSEMVGEVLEEVNKN
jgi:hypothetical protein